MSQLRPVWFTYLVGGCISQHRRTLKAADLFCGVIRCRETDPPTKLGSHTTPFHATPKGRDKPALRSLRVAPVLLECLLEGVQHALVRDDDAQFAVPVERLGGDVLRANEGFLAIYDDDFCGHVEAAVFPARHSTLFGDVRAPA